MTSNSSGAQYVEALLAVLDLTRDEAGVSTMQLNK
jgi:hypothetical protein